MITNEISRPNNSLINHLGTGLLWYSLPSFKLNSSWGALNLVFLNKFIKVMFKSGNIYYNHPFHSAYFFNLYYFVSMPLYKDESSIYKFFRIEKIKTTLSFSFKKQFIIRKHFKKITLDNLRLYRLDNFILVTLFAHIPEPLKRRNLSGAPSQLHNRGLAPAQPGLSFGVWFRLIRLFLVNFFIRKNLFTF